MLICLIYMMSVGFIYMSVNAMIYSSLPYIILDYVNVPLMLLPFLQSVPPHIYVLSPHAPSIDIHITHHIYHVVIEKGGNIQVG